MWPAQVLQIPTSEHSKYNPQSSVHRMASSSHGKQSYESVIRVTGQSKDRARGCTTAHHSEVRQRDVTKPQSLGGHFALPAMPIVCLSNPMLNFHNTGVLQTKRREALLFLSAHKLSSTLRHYYVTPVTRHWQERPASIHSKAQT